MNIQKYRYKERFVTEYDVSEEIYPFCTVKLILQPILENAIYYGVGNMDEDDSLKLLSKGMEKMMQKSIFQLRIMEWECVMKM